MTVTSLIDLRQQLAAYLAPRLPACEILYSMPTVRRPLADGMATLVLSDRQVKRSEKTLPGSTSHILQLEQIRWEEAANYNTMSNFTVKITRNGGTVQYNGCEWTAVEEESRSPLVWQRATLAARQRTEEQNGAAG